ncbi:sorting nexin-13-like isoform X2 [Ruditapes philippinarum]|uniref:sorting nexin-13-like isoform X2 n=1 Tax=Ruditapes philippinarum TaxID=129788 RepID=UPI00295A8368|nr:sorting nexin-13-like isoform X2 [Ruditapes philippinarum]
MMGRQGWFILAVLLYLATFGVYGISLIFYVILSIIGALAVAYYYGMEESMEKLKELKNMLLYSPGILKVKQKMEGSFKIKKMDKRITGSSVIDEVLQSVMEYISRDYIKNWYRDVSDDDLFLLEIQQCVQKVFITFSQRSKDVDWSPYFTHRIVDDLASHIRLYVRAMEKAKVANKDERGPLLEQNFFDLEIKMEVDICRDLVSLSPEDERQYLQDLSDVLLFLLLPTEDYNNKPFRYIMREVLVNGIFIPTIDLLSEPDYINSYIAWMCKKGSLINETFMFVIRTTDSIDELCSVIEQLDCDIGKWRSKDSGGSDDSMIKQNLQSLLYVKELCQQKIKRLQQGIVDTEFAPDVPEYCRTRSLFVLSLDDIIQNNIALTVFIEFMTSVGGENLIYFYLNVEGFRTTAELQVKVIRCNNENPNISQSHQDLEPLRKAATLIYNQYLSEKAPSRIKIESDILKRCLSYIKSKSLIAEVFDEVQARVYQLLHEKEYYETFIQSPVYLKLLEELGFSNDKNDNSDGLSLEDVQRIIWFKNDMNDSSDSTSTSSSLYDNNSRSNSPYTSNNTSFTIKAQISQTGIVRESEKSGKSYAVFSIRVTKILCDDEEIWDVYRRFSDFHDLQMIMSEKLPHFHGPSLPPKTFLKKTGEEFLEKRRKALDNYLQTLLSPKLWDQHPRVKEFVLKFLAPGMWERHKSDLARKMDTIVNPLKTVGHAVIQMPENIKNISHDGLSRLRGDSLKGGSLNQGTKVGAGLDPEIGENIPLRIMLLLMDEVFDLRLKNQWLRRQIVRVLKQLIKAILGDRMNKKIVEHVDFMTSAEQVAEYIKAFRDSFWPEGVLAEPRPERDHNTKMRTRVVCRAKMLGSIPDELRHFLGSDTARIGVTRVFDMFQYRSLNRRLVYVVLEGVIETLFPQNKFKELFRKLHSQSDRLRVASSRNESENQSSTNRGSKT